MTRRRMLSAVGCAFAAGALVATAALRIPAEVDRGPERAHAGDPEAGAPRVPAPSKDAPASAPPSTEPVKPAPPIDPTTTAEIVSPGPGTPRGTTGVAVADGAIGELRGRDLLIPVEGVKLSELRDTFDELRGSRAHEALDILAPRRTPVRAVDDGRIVRLFTSERGGLTVYQFDATERYCYYYAHLDVYADTLAEGRHVSRGTLIGYVGTTGNAPPDTPHLHFAIFVLGPEKRWWEGTAIDPWSLFQ